MEKRRSIGEATIDLGQARRSLRNFTGLPRAARLRFGFSGDLHESCVIVWLTPDRAFVARCRSMPRKF